MPSCLPYFQSLGRIVSTSFPKMGINIPIFQAKFSGFVWIFEAVFLSRQAGPYTQQNSVMLPDYGEPPLYWVLGPQVYHDAMKKGVLYTERD